MRILAPITENQDIASKKYVDDNAGGGGSNVSFRHIDVSDSTQWDSQENEPTQAVLQDIGQHEYQFLIIDNIPISGGVYLTATWYMSLKLDSGDVHLRQYTRFEEGDEEKDEPSEMEMWTIGNFDDEHPSTYLLIQTEINMLKDFKVNGNSIVNVSEVNLITNSSYDANTNPIATISDLNNFEEKLKYDYNGEPYYYQFYGVKSIDNIKVNVGVEVDVVYATLLLINMDIESMKQAYSSTLPAILGIQIPSEDYITTTLVVVIHNLGIMTCTVDASTKYVTEAVFTNYAQGYSVNFGANPNELTVYYSALNSEDYLSKDNTTMYIPSTDYNPATKQYVDTAISNAITNTLNTAV